MAVLEHKSVTAQESEKPVLSKINVVFEKHHHGTPVLIDPDGERIVLPSSLYQVLRQIIHHMLLGRTVFIVPENKELTTHEAADFLNVSRPYLIKLLEHGEIPYAFVGSHRRIRFSDLMTFKARQYAERQSAIDEIAQISQDAGLYD